MLIVDALSTSSPRLFPFLGNMPVVRWSANPDFVVTKILLELIRAYHLEKIFVASGKVQERRMRTKSETFLRDPEGSTPSR
jgi:hypothetical protein